jgi:Zn-dependent protease
MMVEIPASQNRRDQNRELTPASGARGSGASGRPRLSEPFACGNTKASHIMFRAWRIGTAFGIGIFVHWTFLLLPAYVLWSNWGAEASTLLYLLGLVVAVFGCVILHELGHALTARHFGIRTRDITIYPIGGVARLERMSEKPSEELLIALAGPAVNAVLAVLLTFVGFFVLGVQLLSGELLNGEVLVQSPLVSFLIGLWIANVLLAVFNLIPAFPMDGGRVLRALLSWPLGHLRATEVAVGIGAVMAVLIGISTVWTGNPMLILLAAFVFFAGQQELLAVRAREANRRLREATPASEEVIDVLPAEPAETPSRFSGIVWDGRTRRWIIWEDGRAVGTFGAHSQ